MFNNGLNDRVDSTQAVIRGDEYTGIKGYLIPSASKFQIDRTLHIAFLIRVNRLDDLWPIIGKFSVEEYIAMMKELELKLFTIISNVGIARSNFIEALREAKAGKYGEAEKLMAEGNDAFRKGHAVHSELIQSDVSESPLTINLLVIHAEDLLMSAEAFKIIALEMIDNYKRIDALEAKMR